jgi:hypothetical protein
MSVMHRESSLTLVIGYISPIRGCVRISRPPTYSQCDLLPYYSKALALRACRLWEPGDGQDTQCGGDGSPAKNLHGSLQRRTGSLVTG